MHSQIYMFTFWLSTFSFLLLFNWLDFDSKNYGIFWKVWFEELWDVLKVKPCELYYLWLIIITLSHCILSLFFPIQSQINLICLYLCIHSVWVYLYLFNFISSLCSFVYGLCMLIYITIFFTRKFLSINIFLKI